MGFKETLVANIKNRVAEYVADHIDIDVLGNEVLDQFDYSDLASEFDIKSRDIRDSISEDDLLEKVVEAVDMNDLAEEVARLTDTTRIAAIVAKDMQSEIEEKIKKLVKEEIRDELQEA